MIQFFWPEVQEEHGLSWMLPPHAPTRAVVLLYGLGMLVAFFIYYYSQSKQCTTGRFYFMLKDRITIEHM